MVKTRFEKGSGYLTVQYCQIRNYITVQYQQIRNYMTVPLKREGGRRDGMGGGRRGLEGTKIVSQPLLVSLKLFD